MSRYMKIIWINIMEEWDFLNQLMVSELQRPLFQILTKMDYPYPYPYPFPYPVKHCNFEKLLASEVIDSILSD